MVLVIDNYDSFTYNLVQYLGELGAKVQVVRNDAASIDAYVRTILIRTFLAERRSAWTRRVTLFSAYPDLPGAADADTAQVDDQELAVLQAAFPPF